MVAERRKYIRFLARPNSYVALGSRCTKVGKLKDFSIGGLAFEYLCITEDSSPPISEVTIFHTDDGFLQAILQCRVIYDIPKCGINKETVPNSIYVFNRCALHFPVITGKQKERLDYFLTHHTQVLSSSGVAD